MRPASTQTDIALIERFVDAFLVLDERTVFDGPGTNAPGAEQLAEGPPDRLGFLQWRPRFVATEPRHLTALYAKIPARLPPLFERLLTSYRWAEVDLVTFRLLPNPPGEDLSGFVAEAMGDRFLQAVLLPNGLIQFGKGPDVDYDRVCFDTKRRRRDGDCPVVRVDHEEILCNDRLRVTEQLAPDFRSLVETVIAVAEGKRARESGSPGA